LDDMLALENVAAGNIEVRLDVWLIGMKVWGLSLCSAMVLSSVVWDGIVRKL